MLFSPQASPEPADCQSQRADGRPLAVGGVLIDQRAWFAASFGLATMHGARPNPSRASG